MPTYNIVDEGADNTGNTAIDSVLDRIVGDNTTIVFPPGTYKLNELVVPSGLNNLQLIAPDGARLIPGQSGDNVRWFDVYSYGFVLDGFELDMRDTEIPPFVRMNYSSGDWELKRLITRGKVRAATDSNVGSNDSSDARTYFRLSAAEGTRGLLQDCYFHEGACEPTEASNRRAILVESGKGELVFNRCWFELWAENTIYAKKPEGPLRIYNSFFRNTQVGIRLGGNSEVRNCVSIKDDQHPIQAWSGGSLQRGVSVEAVDPADPDNGINSYDGTLTIADSDFYHRYLDSSCGGPITAATPCERLNVQNVRISYDSEKYHDAIYTLNGHMNDGTVANLKYLQLQNIHVRNDHDYQYAVSIEQTPEEWGEVSGVLGGDGPQTDSSYVRDRVTTNGDPTPPNTQPPLPNPPSLGEVPQQSAQLIRIDNTGNESTSSYQITAGTSVLPAGDDGATVTMDWGANDSPARPPDSQKATGTVPAGEVYAFYVTGGIVSAKGSGPATWSVDGTSFTPGKLLSTNTLSTNQSTRDEWHQTKSDNQPTGVVVAKPLSYNGSQPAHVRLQNSMDGDFQYKLEEWGYLDGSHTNETFSTLAVTPAEYKLELDSGYPYRMKAGTISTDETFTTRSFEDFFGTIKPIVLTQTQSFNGLDPVVSRVANVSSDSFEGKIQEAEDQGDHRIETVGYIALQPETGYLDDRPFEVHQTAETVTDQWTQIEFEQQYRNPKFIASLQTTNGLDPASLRYRNLTSTSVEVKVEEARSYDSETNHTQETVGYAVFGEPTLLTNTISSPQQDRDSWHQVNSSIQSTHVVIGKPLSHNGGQPCHVRLRNVADGHFEYKLEEWNYLDGWHQSETFHTLAVEQIEQELQLDDGSIFRIKAGTESVSHNFSSIPLGDFFGTERPVILAQPQTFNGPQPTVSRIRNISSDSFAVGLQEEGSDPWHTRETLGYVAFQQASGQFNRVPFEVQRTEENVTHQWYHIPFQQNYKSPQFIADIQTYNGVNTSNLRYRNLSSTGVEVKIEEEQSVDDETRHQNAEVIGYAVFEGSI
ncbi:hypothetical protein [Haladaptatus salinisoli]|uniref:hypothetical protein n=1 Tax=Haladaptatus salinisoli TaxID=2884876 RepID=UPI001D09F539|nr:hypothetical protein [Haladaptatus salinisoli]